MAYQSKYSKPKTFKERVNSAKASGASFLRKLVLATAGLGAVGGFGWYEYGTIKEEEVKVRTFTSVWNEKENRSEYTFGTDKGDFTAEKSMLHRQSQADATNVYIAINKDKTYRIKSYGVRFPGNSKLNILSAREVTEEELKEREALKAIDKQKAQQNAQTQPKQAVPVVPGQPGVAGPAQAGLSGEVVTYPVQVNGYSVQLTVPVEVVGKVTVNTVRPLTQSFQPAAAPAQAVEPPTPAPASRSPFSGFPQ